jgi:hypothetical protein
MPATPAIDEAKLEEFMGQFVQDLGACATAPLVLIGDKLGLYKAMADGEAVTPAELARRTGCRERYLREWLCQQAASGYATAPRGCSPGCRASHPSSDQARRLAGGWTALPPTSASSSPKSRTRSIGASVLRSRGPFHACLTVV